MSFNLPLSAIDRADAARAFPLAFTRRAWYTEFMTRLIFINGTMGAGKTAVCRLLQNKLPANVFLDGDDVWNMRPFTVNEATKEMVLSNIGAVLENFLASGQFDNVLFCWVMHEREIVDDILARLKMPFDFRFFTLTCEKAALKARLEKDVAAGTRTRGVIARSAERAGHYQNMGSEIIDTTRLTAEEVSEQIAARLLEEDFTAEVFDALPAEAKNIREEVFVREQGFCGEFDERDKKSKHVVLFYHLRPAGTCRFFADEKGWHIGRVALLRNFRGLHAGERLMRFAEEQVRAAGGKEISLDAQVRAAGFYEKCGYCPVGEIFAEEGCPHRRMIKKLRNSD